MPCNPLRIMAAYWMLENKLDNERKNTRHFREALLREELHRRQSSERAT
jgi:hypothetical protein